MNKTNKVNLMVSTDRHGQGGIATVITGYHEGGLIEDMKFISISTHSSANTTKLTAIFTYLFSLLRLVYYGIFKKLGIVHIHMASRGSYIRKSKILRLAKFLGAKTIIHLHGAEFETFYNKECSESKKQHIRDTFNMADKVIVLSSQWLIWVNKIVTNKNRTCVVYNPLPVVELPQKKSKRPIILFLGRLGQRKGVQDLINAFAKIADKFPDTELHFGGDGDLTQYKNQAKALGIEKQVVFLGWVAGVTKDQCLADATIYCLPSYNEGFPMGILEAMAAEVAVVATTVGGIPDAITDRKEGLLIEAGDIDALAIALSSMLRENNVREQYAAAAKMKFRNNFSHEVIIPQLKSIYQQLLDKNE
jgi:glycosyltransferase involved in cell wall biosynthesis